jgi:LacI family transcriptional regulator
MITMKDAEAAAVEMLRGLTPDRDLLGPELLTIGAIGARSLAAAEVALVGFDDLALGDLLDPAVTVVAHDPSRLGRTAADMLFRRLDGHASPAQHVICPFELIHRGSGEIPPRAS